MGKVIKLWGEDGRELPVSTPALDAMILDKLKDFLSRAEYLTFSQVSTHGTPKRTSGLPREIFLTAIKLYLETGENLLDGYAVTLWEYYEKMGDPEEVAGIQAIHAEEERNEVLRTRRE